MRENDCFPSNAVIAGVPAKQVAERDSYAANIENARFYQRLSDQYLKGMDRLPND